MQLTYLEAIRQGIWEEMERDPTVFCIGEDIGIYGGAFKVTDGFIDRFGPERVIDTPIAEAAIVDAAFGASLTGMRPSSRIPVHGFHRLCFQPDRQHGRQSPIIVGERRRHSLSGGQAAAMCMAVPFTHRIPKCGSSHSRLESRLSGNAPTTQRD